MDSDNKVMLYLYKDIGLFWERTLSSDGENGETDTWLDYALDCKYLKAEDHSRLTEENRAVGSMLGAMLNNPLPFLTKPG
jgi:four helix bundle protein